MKIYKRKKEKEKEKESYFSGKTQNNNLTLSC